MTNAELITLVRKNPVGFGCGLVSMGLAAAIYFRSGAIPAASAELDEKTATGQRYALNLANAAQLKEQVDALVAANKEIDARLIRAGQIGINQQFFYKLETDTGVKLIDLRQGGRGQVKGGFVPIGFTVTVQGDYAQVLTFVRALESGAHYCRVLTASCSGGRSGPITLNLNLELLGSP